MVALGSPRESDEHDVFNMGSFPGAFPSFSTSSWPHGLRTRPARTPSIPES